MDTHTLFTGLLLWHSAVTLMPGTEHWCSPGHCWVFPDRGKQLYLILELSGKMLLNSGSFWEPLTCPLPWGCYPCILHILLNGCSSVAQLEFKIAKQAERLERGKKRDLKSLENFHWHRTDWDEISSSREGWWEQHCHLPNTLGKIWFSPDCFYFVDHSKGCSSISTSPRTGCPSLPLKR